MRQLTRGSITFKLWDISGQPRFRPTWTRYCLGVGVVVFVVDSADPTTFPVARDELHSLLKELPRVVSLCLALNKLWPVLTMDRSPVSQPVLVLGNKTDLTPHATNSELIRALDLRQINDREVSFFAISGKFSRSPPLSCSPPLTRLCAPSAAKSQANLDKVVAWLEKRT